MVEFFDLIKIIFTNDDKYKDVTRGEKQKHYFLLQRRFAINFPMQANALQSLKINQSAVIDYWKIFLNRYYKTIPGWMYTKGVKKSQEIKEKKSSVSKALIDEYCKYMKVDRKSVMDALEFYENDMIKELKAFEIILKQK
ncbi:hypothetical protein M0Q50_06415 [bacterium]|jgi:hypothetical protein|nr:hypothetical protein [bacterium]